MWTGVGAPTTSISVLCVLLLGVLTAAVVRFDDFECFSETEISTVLECQSTTYRSDGKMPLIKQLMNKVSSNMSIAKMGMTPIQARTHKAPNIH